MKILNKYFSVLRINWIQALEYRANALIGLFAVLSGLFIEYQMWSLIGIDRIPNNTLTEGTLTFNRFIMFIFLSIIVGQLKSSWVTSSEMIREIREGGINRYLVKPISYFKYNFMMFIGGNSLFFVAYAMLIICLTIIFKISIFVSVYGFIGFIISLAISMYLSFCIYFVMVCFAFWFGEVRSIVVAYNLGMLFISGQYIPIDLFPEKVLSILNWTPIPYLVDSPVKTAMGYLTYNEWLNTIVYSMIWCIILTIISIIIYRRGIIQYEAYGQ